MSDKRELIQKDKGLVFKDVLTKSIVERVFLKDYRRAFIYKKTGKLSVATNVVLSHMSEVKGMTDRLGELSTELIKEVLLIGSDGKRSAEKASFTILEILGLLEVAKGREIIAVNNADILAREYGYLLATICDSCPRENDIKIDTEVEDEVSFKEVRREVSIKKVSILLDERKKKIKDSRGEKILKILKDKGQASIKDISKIVLDVSEKTIQRELNQLISKGQIRKEGERRWSIYHYNI